jgi:anti-sigma B factor antagonist
MAGELLSVRSERRGDAYHVEPAGELDIATAELLEHELDNAQQSDAATIVLDLSGLSFIDSTGLRVVIDCNERCGGENGRLRVIAGAPAVERLLDIVGLRERLPLITP